MWVATPARTITETNPFTGQDMTINIPAGGHWAGGDHSCRTLAPNEGIPITMNLQWHQLETKIERDVYDCPMHYRGCPLGKRATGTDRIRSPPSGGVAGGPSPLGWGRRPSSGA